MRRSNDRRRGWLPAAAGGLAAALAAGGVALAIHGSALATSLTAAGAEGRLARAVAVAPDDDEALHQLILSLRAQRKHAEAVGTR